LARPNRKTGIKTLNPIAIIQQNIHKFYLRDLQKLGLILPTVLLTKRTILILLNDSVTLERAVIKPAFSAGSHRSI
jgi:hypothetical protein